MKVTVVRAWPEGHASVALQASPGMTVDDAVRASGLPIEGVAGFAVFGVRVDGSTGLNDGDRVELLRPLLIDPKEARRRRAAAQAPKKKP